MSRWAVGSSRTRIGAAWATRDGDEHQLPLAERQRACVAAAQVTGADPLDRGIDGHRVGGREPRQRRLVRQPAERDDLLDGHRERQLGELGDDRDRAGDGLPADRLERGARTSRTDPLRRLERPGQDAQQRRLAGPVRPDEGDPLAGVERQVDVRRGSAATRTRRDTPDSRQDRFDGHSSYPVRDR